MINQKDNDALTMLAQREDPDCKHWNCYVEGHWICYICHNPIADPEEHGIKHLDEKAMSAFR
jgi:hypothetical protein